MIIDFHTHIFPESIAKNAIHNLEQESGIKAKGIGTLSNLKENMKIAGVDYSVILPVATKPSQFHSINEYAQEINNTDGIISFGGIHPENDNITEKLSYIKKLGLKGVKLHPDYQGPTYIDDPRYIQIIKECIRLDLCMVIHAGMDVGKPIPIHCPPDKSYIMLNEVLRNCTKDSKIVLAHMGGMLQWDLVEKLLVGKNIYFDLAYCNHLGNKEQITRIIKKHGADKILYATDYPWTNQEEMTNYINTLDISSEEKEMILYKNAAKLLDIPI
ncbi:MAG: amidohydrolase family protein [Lachnospiraceae bacterium]